MVKEVSNFKQEEESNLESFKTYQYMQKKKINQWNKQVKETYQQFVYINSSKKVEENGSKTK